MDKSAFNLLYKYIINIFTHTHARARTHARAHTHTHTHTHIYKDAFYALLR